VNSDDLQEQGAAETAVVVLEVNELRKVFHVRSEASRGTDELVAVDNVSFTLRESGSLAIVGESGSGKTTVARMIAGLETPTSGSVRIAEPHNGSGEVAASSSRAGRRERRRRIQMVFQDPYSSLNPQHTIQRCLEDVLRLHFRDLDSAARVARVAQLLDYVGLDQRHLALKPRSLSGGQRQRVAIARALACEPRVLMLDEAVSALDVSVQGQILNLLSDLRSTLGVAYLFVSHDLAVVQQVTDDVIVMHRGVVVERGTTDAVLTRPSADYTRRLLDAVPRPGWRPTRHTSLERPLTSLLPMPGRTSRRGSEATHDRDGTFPSGPGNRA
jgi:ABC-type glutathione transport system ATPase component